MAFRLDLKYSIPDARVKIKQKQLNDLGLAHNAQVIDFFDTYTIDLPLRRSDLPAIVGMLQNPLVEKAGSAWDLAPRQFTWAIEIGYLPGVTDNVGNTVKQEISELAKKTFKNTRNVYYSYVLFVSGKIDRAQITRFAESLYNPLIQRAAIKSFAEFQKTGGMGLSVPKVVLKGSTRADRVDLELPAKELAKLGKEGLLNSDGSRRGPLALGIEELRAIREYFRKVGRQPTDVEIECLAQTWSEHCKHTIFNDLLDNIKEGIFRRYIRRATEEIRERKGKNDFCVSVFSDNSGAIVFDENFLLTHKMETHNTPSALDPFGGAITGIVGVNRDTLGFGLGAKPVANLYGFCLANPDDQSVLYRDEAGKNKMLSAKRILEGVVAGINSGGNQSGIPTPSGFLYFDPRFRGKPLVFAGTVGLIPRQSTNRPSHQKRAQSGDYIVMIGGRVGRDGIHGATFSSEALDSHSPAAAVQIGDPITQKKLSDALVREARDLGLYHSITDNGAGGFSCSVSEMAKEVRLPDGRQGGCEVWLDRVPLKYPGLMPWQIWISESQERMTLAVPKNKWRKLETLFRKRGVEATIIGQFTQSGRCVVKYGRQIVADIDMNFLHDGRPKKFLKSKVVKTKHAEPKLRLTGDFSRELLDMLKRPNLTSTQFVNSQYDHEVQGGSVLKPLVGRGRVHSDATVFRPVLGSARGVVLASGIYPAYSDIDTYHMAAAALDTAIRNTVTAGGNLDHLAILDNFCWSSGNDPKRLYELKRAAKACYDYALFYGTPFISGKDSMFNDFKGFADAKKPIKISIPPTLLISAVSVMKDISKAVSADLKFPGDLIYLLGETREELGGSEYFKYLSEKTGKKTLGNKVPKVNAAKNLKLYRALQNAIEAGLVASTVSIGRGGLSIALARTAMAGNLGVSITLPDKLSAEIILFSESQGRIAVSVDPKKAAKFEKIMAENTVARIGKVVREKNLAINNVQGKKIINISVTKALTAYRSTFKNY